MLAVHATSGTVPIVVSTGVLTCMLPVHTTCGIVPTVASI